MADCIRDVRNWLEEYLQMGYAHVAIDDGGLTLVILDGDDEPTEAHYEIGGIPKDD